MLFVTGQVYATVYPSSCYYYIKKEKGRMRPIEMHVLVLGSSERDRKVGEGIWVNYFDLCMHGWPTRHATQAPPGLPPPPGHHQPCRCRRKGAGSAPAGTGQRVDGAWASMSRVLRAFPFASTGICPPFILQSGACAVCMLHASIIYLFICLFVFAS